MAAVVSGPVREIAYNHPTLGTGFFYPKGDADATLDPGGLRKSDDDNGVDGGGRAIFSMMPRRWSVEASIACDNVTTQENLKLVALAAAPQEAVFTFTMTSGTVYKGTGSIVGDIQEAALAGTVDVKFAGGGILEKIV